MRLYKCIAFSFLAFSLLAFYGVAYAEFPTSNPSVLVLYPNGGEVLTKGWTYVVKWQGPVGTPYELSLFDANGIFQGYIVQNYVALNNQYSWTLNTLTVENENSSSLNEVFTKAYKLHVETIYNGVEYSDDSNSLFTVVDATPTNSQTNSGSVYSSGGTTSYTQSPSTGSTSQTNTPAETPYNLKVVQDSNPTNAYSLDKLSAQVRLLELTRTLAQLQSSLAENQKAVDAVIKSDGPVKYSWSSDLYFGMTSNADVVMLQKALQAEGVYSGPITGNFYNLTREGIKAFQLKHKFKSIPDTGYVGPYTRKVLNGLYPVK